MIGLFLGRQIDEDIERVIILFSDNPLKVFESTITSVITLFTILSLCYYFFFKNKNKKNWPKLPSIRTSWVIVKKQMEMIIPTLFCFVHRVSFLPR